jgi:hypothetical protein
MPHTHVSPNRFFVFISRSDGWDTRSNPVIEWLKKDFGYEMFSGTKGVITAFRGGTNLQYIARSVF